MRTNHVDTIVNNNFIKLLEKVYGNKMCALFKVDMKNVMLQCRFHDTIKDKNLCNKTYRDNGKLIKKCIQIWWNSTNALKGK